MMKNNRLTYTLLVLFFGSLFVYWALEYAGVRTGKERRLRETRLLPGLTELPEGDVRELSIDKGTTKLVFRRRGAGIGQWQMIQPRNVAAEPTRLETLVRNLKDLRRSVDSGNVAGAPRSLAWNRRRRPCASGGRRHRHRRPRVQEIARPSRLLSWARRCAATATFGPSHKPGSRWSITSS